MSMWTMTGDRLVLWMQIFMGLVCLGLVGFGIWAFATGYFH